jgi:hypothetical protein
MYNINSASENVDFIQILDLKKASGPDKISHKMHKIAPEKTYDNFCVTKIKHIMHKFVVITLFVP